MNCKATKRVLALMTAAAMLLCANVPTIAADTETNVDSGWNPGGIGGELATPQIKMVVPTFGANTLTFDIYNQLGTGEQVISGDLTFKNRSTVPVNVTLSSYTLATASSNALTPVTDPALVEPENGASATTKNILLYMVPASGGNAVDGYTYPAYDKTNADGKFGVFGALTNNAMAYTLGTPARGKQGTLNSATGKIEASPLDAPEETAKAFELTFRFDGALNSKARWDKDEAITVTPVFEITPVKNDGGSTGGGNITLTNGTTTAASTFAALSGGTVTVTSPDALNTTLAAADYVVTIKSNSGTDRAVSVSGATVAGNVITFKVKGDRTATNPVAVGDIITVQLNASAFVDSSKGGSKPLTITVA